MTQRRMLLSLSPTAVKKGTPDLARLLLLGDSVLERIAATQCLPNLSGQALSTIYCACDRAQPP